jgi:hypothetical protein
MKINKINGGTNDDKDGEFIKGGFPRIKICDDAFIKKIKERKPREFNRGNILRIKDIIATKKEDSLFDLMTESPTLIIEGDAEFKKINGISIETIIGKK